MLATIIALFGFNGYQIPREHVKACEFCRMSGGGRNVFFATLNGPQAKTDPGEFTEGVWSDSIVGCLCVPRARVSHRGSEPLLIAKCPAWGRCLHEYVERFSR